VDDDEDEPTLGKTVPSLLQIVKTEESLAAWKKKARSPTLGVKQMEMAHILTHNKICLPERPRKHYPGTNCGDVLADVKVPPPEAVWQLTWKEKKQLYGKKQLIAVGGKTDAGCVGRDSGQIAKRTDATVEPVIFHPMPPWFYETILSDFFANKVFDLTPTDEEFAYVCLCLHVGYVGICYTQEHKEFIERRLIERLAVDMADASTPVYNAAYALAVGKAPEKAAIKGRKKTEKDPKLTKKAKKDTNGKKDKKAKKDKKDDDEEDESASDPFSGEDDSDCWDPLET
jgi:hypothetical protein